MVTAAQCAVYTKDVFVVVVGNCILAVSKGIELTIGILNHVLVNQ